MSTEVIQTPPLPRQARSVPGWLGADRLKRGVLLYWAALFTISSAAIHFAGLLKQVPQSGLLLALLLAGSLIQAAAALAVVAMPARRPLIAAAIIEGAAALLWITVHITGLPIGSTLWRIETYNALDLYLPFMEGVSAIFFLCLFGRTWSSAARAWRITLAALPSVLIIAFLLWAAINYKFAELFTAIFVLTAGLPDSFLDLFLPAVGLLALIVLLCSFIPRLRTRTPGAWRIALLLLPVLLLVSVTTWAGTLNAANAAWFPASSTVRAPAGQMTTLAYCSPGGNPLAMDLSEPAAGAPRPAPVVFYMHGGEGLQGNRQLHGTDDAYFAQLRDALVSRGFVVGSIDYGLFPFYKLVDQVKQTRCAVRFLRAHASELGIDPQRIGAYGVSMGGYLAAMLGTVRSPSIFDAGQYLDQSSRVQAVIDMWGPTDLNNWSGSPSWVHSIGQALGGGGNSSAAKIRTINPLSYVAPGDPPFLILQGADDWFIAPHHSQDLARLLHAAGDPVKLVMIQHDGHGLAAATAGYVEQPAPDVLIHMINDFFVRTLAA